jgi:hypothetical protein
MAWIISNRLIPGTTDTGQRYSKNCLKFFNILFFKTIIFIRDRNAKSQEVSGYIDYAHRLKTEEFEGYFTGKKKLVPRPTDLSFYNWENQMISSNNTPNYQVIAENVKGLLFKNKRDRKIINVDPYVIYFESISFILKFD